VTAALSVSGCRGQEEALRRRLQPLLQHHAGGSEGGFSVGDQRGPVGGCGFDARGEGSGRELIRDPAEDLFR